MGRGLEGLGLVPSLSEGAVKRGINHLHTPSQRHRAARLALLFRWGA